jgi:hypothetical protein
MQGLELVKVFLWHPIPLVLLRSGAVTSECEVRHVHIIPQVEPLLPPPFHRFGHVDVEIRIDGLPGLDVDNDPPPTNWQLCVTMDVGRRRNSFTSRSGDRSPCRPRIGSQRPQCARSLKWSDCAAPSDSATTVSGGIDATAHRIPTHKMTQRRPCIPPSTQGTQGPRAHNRS